MVLVSLCVFAQAARADLMIIVNNEVAASELDRETLQAIFLGKKTQWQSGESIEPVSLKKGPIHQEFLKTVVRRTQSQYSSFWKRAIFTGTGTPPKSVATEEEVVEFVRASVGAIGYIDSSTSHEGVKVLSIR
jgi:ABC-type phosphate transport system substrate-binding protein